MRSFFYAGSCSQGIVQVCGAKSEQGTISKINYTCITGNVVALVTSKNILRHEHQSCEVAYSCGT
jgi:hypothetical protein